MELPISSFAEHLAVRRVSPNTVRSYTGTVRMFAAHCDSHGIHWASAHHRDLAAFLASNPDHAAATLAIRLRGLRCFYRFAVADGYASDNPAVRVPWPKLSRRMPRSPTVLQVQAVRSSFDLSHWRGVRNRAIVSLLFGSGARLSEVSGCRLVDLSLRDGTVIVHGKGNADRALALPELAVDDLRDWLHVRPPLASPFLFVGRGTRYQLTPDGIYSMLLRAARRAGVDRAVFHPHALRHGCALSLHRAGASTRAIQRQYGHGSLVITERYLQQLGTDVDDLRDMMRRHDPFARRTDRSGLERRVLFRG